MRSGASPTLICGLTACLLYSQDSRLLADDNVDGIVVPFCVSNSQCFPGTYCEKPIGDCSGQGRCQMRPGACQLVYKPICGCDAATYPSACEAAYSGVNVAYSGPCGPARVVRWTSVASHDIAGALGIVLDPSRSGNGIAGPTVETRISGIEEIDVEFDRSVVLTNADGITVVGRTTIDGVLDAPFSYTPSYVSMINDRTMQILFAPGELPHDTCYTITLPFDLVIMGLTDDRDCMVRALFGDVTGSGDVTLSDALAIKSREGADAATDPQFDIDLSGDISIEDALFVKSWVVSPAHQALCP